MANKKSNYYVIGGFMLLIAYGIYYQYRSDKFLQEDGVYTIGTVDTVEGGGQGCGVLVYTSFIYNKNKYQVSDCDASGTIHKSLIGERFFIKITISKLDRSTHMNYHCPVPDSIKNAPDDGWSEDWMKKHFPGCVMDTLSK